MKYLFLTILSLFIFIPAITHGATEFISTIQQSGGDYSTLSSWEGAVQTTLASSTTRVYSGTGVGELSVDDVVEWYSGTYQNATGTVVATTSSQILLRLVAGSAATVSSGDQWRLASTTDNMFTVSGSGSELGDTAIAIAKIDGAWSSADVTAVTILGWSTSAANYIKIYTTDTARHTGKWDTGKYRLESDGYALQIKEEYVRIEGLQIYVSNYVGDVRGISVMSQDAATDIRISHNIIKFTDSWPGNASYPTPRGIFLNDTDITARIWNNIIYDFTDETNSYGQGIFAHQGTALYVYNNTVVNSFAGIIESYMVPVAKNNIVQDCTTNFSGTFDNSSTNNLSDDATYTSSTADFINSEVSFVDENGDDFHLSGNDSNARNRGTDLSTDANLPFSDDIDGQTRGYRGWDIGADETFASTMINTTLKNKLTDGLVGHWTFNGQDMDWASTTAEVLDRSGNSNNGNVTNFDQTSVTGGISGQALEFDGVNDYVDMGNNVLFDSTKPCTISFWTKLLNWQDSVDWYYPQPIQLKTDQATGFLIFYTRRSGYRGVTFGSNANFIDLTTNSGDVSDNILFNRWAHVVLIFDGVDRTAASSYTLYLDKSITSTADSPNIGTTANSNIMGYSPNSSDSYFNGLVDEVRIYDRALSADEVEELYRAGARRLQPDAPMVQKQTGGLVGHWTFNGQDMDWASTTAEALDRSGNSNNGNVTNFGQEAVTGGISGQALEFDGEDDYVDLSTISLTGEFTASVWINVRVITAAIAQYFLGHGNNDYMRAQSNDIYLKINNLGYEIDLDTTTLVANAWYHVVVTRNSSDNMTVYIDGQAQADTEATSDTVTISKIGTKRDGANHFNGTIDEVRIYNRALSAEEVEDLYQAGAGRMKLK